MSADMEIMDEDMSIVDDLDMKMKMDMNHMDNMDHMDHSERIFHGPGTRNFNKINTSSLRLPSSFMWF